MLSKKPSWKLILRSSSALPCRGTASEPPSRPRREPRRWQGIERGDLSFLQRWVESFTRWGMDMKPIVSRKSRASMWSVTNNTFGHSGPSKGGTTPANKACPCRHIAVQIAVSLCVLGATAGLAAAQQPTKSQQNTLRSACRNDFMAHCSKVKPSGPAALGCLQRNAASLSAKCRTAVSAVGGGSAPAGAPPAARPAPAPTQDTNVAFVEAVSGRVIAFARGKPALLENSDMISDPTQLDLQANSELRFCHFRANRLLTLRGPSRAWVSAEGVTDERGRAINAAVGTCTPPVR
jgi:Cysteine rich repeat